VAALVYIAAFQPDNGESALQWLQTAPPAPENGVLPPDEKGIVYYDKAKYHAGFCADIDEEEADFMFASQGAFYGKAFVTPITNASWRTKPAYGLIATEDKSIAPEIQRKMYGRSKTRTKDVKGSHVIFMSQPKLVADTIIEAAENAVIE
jgi:hypothetical protein